jgi:hypothetical protein
MKAMKQQVNMAADTGLQQLGGGPGPATTGVGPVPSGPAPPGGTQHEGGGLAPHELDYFTLGMVVEMETLHKRTLTGEVVAFDLNSKMLAIKSLSASGRSGTSDIQIVNLSFVSDIKVITEAQDQSPPLLPNLSLAKLNTRTTNNIEQKLRKIGYTGINVSPTAQKLVNAITKTITEVRWDGQNIVVLDQVTIAPPYEVNSCRLNEGHASQANALQHVKKLVGKFHKENSDSKSPPTVSSSAK